MSRTINYQEVDRDTYLKAYATYKGSNEKEDFHKEKRYYVNKELLEDE